MTLILSGRNCRIDYPFFDILIETDNMDSIYIRQGKGSWILFFYEDVFLKNNNVLSELHCTMCVIIENNL